MNALLPGERELLFGILALGYFLGLALMLFYFLEARAWGMGAIAVGWVTTAMSCIIEAWKGESPCP